MEIERTESAYYAFVGELDAEYENMITLLSTATLLSEIESPEGNKYTATEEMLLAALKSIYNKEQHGLMHL
eukprot:12932101-Prorocentrum_lima.AAC.1